MDSKEAKQRLQHSIDRNLYHIDLAKQSDNDSDLVDVCNSSIELSQFLINMIDENEKNKIRSCKNRYRK